MTLRRSLVVALVVALVAAPGADAGRRKKRDRKAKADKDQVQVLLADAEIPVEQLLDVGIRVLHDGLPDDEAEIEQLESKGVFADVRKSEARYIPFHLKDTLQATGQWGAVRILPSGSENADLILDGEILESNGRELTLFFSAVDSSGRVWLNNKYRETVDSVAYRPTALERRDAFQNLYNAVANDLVERRAKLDPDELRQIREVTRLRYAADLVPNAYGDYLEENRRGRVSVERLPAEGDPMMQRIERIQERDYLFIDTLNEHYAEFYTRMRTPYLEWRKFSHEEQVALAQLRKESLTRMVVGGLLTGAGLFFGGGSTIGKIASDAAVVGGVATAKKGWDLTKEAKIHREALHELAQSFDSEMEPLLVDIDGKTLRLEGTAEGQYAAWRKLLHEIFESETGLPPDPNASASLDAPGGSK